MLFPIDEENIYPLSRFTEEAYTLELMGSRGVRGAIWKHTAFIKQTNYSFNDIIELDKEISKIIRFNFELEGGNYTFLTPD